MEHSRRKTFEIFVCRLTTGKPSQRRRNDRDRSDQNVALLKPFWATLPHIHCHSPVRRSSGHAKYLLCNTIVYDYEAGNGPSTYNELWNQLSLSLDLSDFFLDDTKTLNILAYIFVHATILFKQNSFSVIKICLPFCLKNQNEVAYAGIIANRVSCDGHVTCI